MTWMHIEGRIVSSINHVGKNIYIHMKKNGIGPLCYHTQISTQNELKYEIKFMKIIGKKSIGKTSFTLYSCRLSCFSCAWLFATLLTVAHQAPLSMGFSRQEYWSRFQCLIFPWKIIQGIFQPWDQTHISYVCCIGRQILYC